MSKLDARTVLARVEPLGDDGTLAVVFISDYGVEDVEIAGTPDDLLDLMHEAIGGLCAEKRYGRR